jgi:hypothetical protein
LSNRIYLNSYIIVTSTPITKERSASLLVQNERRVKKSPAKSFACLLIIVYSRLYTLLKNIPLSRALFLHRVALRDFFLSRKQKAREMKKKLILYVIGKDRSFALVADEVVCLRVIWFNYVILRAIKTCVLLSNHQSS